MQLLSADDTLDDDPDNIQTIDDLVEYDDVSFGDSIRSQASERRSSSKRKQNSVGESNVNQSVENGANVPPEYFAYDHENYENTNNASSASNDVLNESSSFEAQSFDSGLPQGLGASDEVEESQSIVAQFPESAQIHVAGNDSESGDDDGESYEDNDITNALHASTSDGTGLPVNNSVQSFQEQIPTKTHDESLIFASERPPPLPSSPPPLPDVPPPMLEDEPSSPFDFDSFPRVPPRRDLVAASVEASGTGLPSAQVPSINISGNLAESVERRQKPDSGDSSPRLGSGPRVAILSPRNSYFIDKDDQTHILREDSQGIPDTSHPIPNRKALLLASKRANGSLSGFNAANDDANYDDDNLYDSPPPTMYNY